MKVTTVTAAESLAGDFLGAGHRDADSASPKGGVECLLGERRKEGVAYGEPFRERFHSVDRAQFLRQGALAGA